MAEVRRRQVPDSSSSDIKSKIRQEDGRDKLAHNSITFTDILRILGGIVLLNGALSYYITGDKFAWGFRPWYADPKQVSMWLVSCTLSCCTLYQHAL